MKRICLIELGGTIASFTEDPKSEFYGSPQKSVAIDLEIEGINLIRTELFCKISQDLTIDDLLLFMNTLKSYLEGDDVFGAVITVGTNAVEDISYLTGLLVRTEKPIVFTGSHYPQGSLCFDGKLNLYNALIVAASEKAKRLGCLLTFNGVVISAREACKSSPGTLDNFLSSAKSGFIGDVNGGYFNLKFIPNYRHTFASEFDIKEVKKLAKVCIIYAHLELDEFLINAAIEAGVSGIVSAGFGKGYQSKKITDALYRAVNSGIVIVRCPRIGISYSGIDKDYDDRNSFIVSKGLTPHKSSLLLSLACLFTKDRESLMRVFEEY